MITSVGSAIPLIYMRVVTINYAQMAFVRARSPSAEAFNNCESFKCLSNLAGGSMGCFGLSGLAILASTLWVLTTLVGFVQPIF